MQIDNILWFSNANPKSHAREEFETSNYAQMILLDLQNVNMPGFIENEFRNQMLSPNENHENW